MLCWAESWQIYLDECYQNGTTSYNWIIINQFDKNYTNDMIKNI